MEAANTTPSTSKVIIQCTDPDNLLEPFESRLSGWTPLRNLHWKSPTRPLRSIPSLSVSLVRKVPTQNGATAGTRRHQIPGLRETPYLKLYLLRCDDKEGYKESARKEIKQWIKENTLEKESKSVLRNQEHHDAYEWMIIHVVVPGTAAATQAKSSKHISLEMTESTDSVNSTSKSKWPGKSTSTIFDKLRADFNSSKSAIPRVAQVRLTEQGKPPGALSLKEIEEQWQDLVDNLKAAILGSFDTRVSEYEEDIRERENQRSLPGWNFCTFFVLKEGLARGFENVGLLDDALAAYNELEMGLDTVIKENTSDDADSPGALLPYSRDLKQIIRKALDTASEELLDSSGQFSSFTLTDIVQSVQRGTALDIDGDRYRDLILKNQVSALDLRIYMFTRKMDILLRQSKLTISARGSNSSQIDFSIVSALAEMASSFLTFATREYRSDFYAAWGGRLSGVERITQRVVISNVVATWTWSATFQIIARLLPALQKNALNLAESHDILSKQLLARDEVQEKRPVSQDRHSMSSDTSSSRQKDRSRSLPRGASISQDQSEAPAHQPKPLKRIGYDEVCASIARLLLLARNVLEELPATSPYTESLRNFQLAGQHRGSGKSHRISSWGPAELVNGSAHDHSPTNTESQLLCLDSAILMQASSSDAFNNLYLLLSACAGRLFDLAGQHRALSQVLTELAVHAYSSGQKSLAASYLGKFLDVDLDGGVAFRQSFAGVLYAECLNATESPNRYAQCHLACMQTFAAQESVDMTRYYFERLLEVATLIDPVTVSMSSIIKIQSIDKVISHFDDRDGFRLSLQFRSNVQLSLVADEMNLVVSSAGQSDPEHVRLTGPQELHLESKTGMLIFSSNVNTHGWYNLEHLEIKFCNLVLRHDFQHEPEQTVMRSSKFQPPSVLVFPRSDALSVSLMPSPEIVLGQTRKLSLVVQPGPKEISTIRIRVRAASAGLRLNLHDACQEPLTTVREDDSRVLELHAVHASLNTTIEIPYSLETASDPSLTVKCEVNYTTNEETFTLYQVCSVDVILPVSVNVQDVHRDTHWFSRFFIRPATLVPIVLRNCTIEKDSDVQVVTGSDFDQPVMVFPQQPATWTVRLRHSGKTKPRLVLNVEYQCLDETILTILKNKFEALIQQSDHPQASSFLSTHLIQTVKHGWTEQDLEVAGLTREIELWRMQDMDWPSVLCAFNRPAREHLRATIEQWQSEVSPIPIDLDEAPVRLLKLVVNLLPPPPVIKTGLQLASDFTTVPMGQPLMCELSLEVSGLGEDGHADKLEFSYELFAPSEAWLIGGRKKGSFHAETNAISIQVVLFPQRVGILLLPMIDVRCRRHEHTTQGHVQVVDVPIDVHNRTLSKSLQVTSNMRSTTIGLSNDEETRASSGTLLDSQSMVEPG